MLLNRNIYIQIDIYLQQILDFQQIIAATIEYFHIIPLHLFYIYYIQMYYIPIFYKFHYLKPKSLLYLKFNRLSIELLDASAKQLAAYNAPLQVRFTFLNTLANTLTASTSQITHTPCWPAEVEAEAFPARCVRVSYSSTSAVDNFNLNLPFAALRAMCVCLSRIRGRRSNICCATASFLPSVRPNVRLSFLANFRVLFPALFVYLHTQAAYAVHPTPYTLHHRLPCKIAQIIIIIIKEGNSRVSREAERIRKRRQPSQGKLAQNIENVQYTHIHIVHTQTHNREKEKPQMRGK